MFSAMKHSRVLIICVISVILSWSSFASLQAQETVILADKQDEYPLGLHLEILEDIEGRWTIDDVISPEIARQFVPSRSEVPNFGFTDSVYWIRFRIRNTANLTRQWYLVLGYPNVHYLDFYHPLPDRSGLKHIRTGTLLPFDTRDVKDRLFVFTLSLPADIEQTIYLRFESKATMVLSLTIQSGDRLKHNGFTDRLWLGCFYGVLFIMAGYNLFLFLALRERSYLYYVLTLFSVIIYEFSFGGLAQQYLWPNLEGMNRFVVPFSLISGLIAALKFAGTFLQTRVQVPKGHQAISVLLIILGLLLIASPFISYTVVLTAVDFLYIPGMLCIVGVGFITWRRGYRPARYYLLAGIAVLTTMLVHIMVCFTLLPSNLLTQHSYQVGIILLVLLLSLALADRINLIKEEKAEAQAEVLQKQQEKLKQTAELARINEALNAEITERKRMEEALRESEKKYRRLIEHANEIIVVVQDGRFKLVNPTAIELTEYSREELLSKPFIEFVHPEDRDVILDRYRRRQQGEQLPATYPVRIIHKTGAIRWFEVRAVLIEWEGKLATLTFLNDITKRKHAEEELTKYKSHLEELVEQRTAELLRTNKQLTKEISERRRAEQSLAEQSAFLDEVFNEIQEGIGIVDEREVIVFCNPMFAEIFEEDIEELIGENLLSFFDAETHSMILQQTEIRKTGKSSTYEVPLITRQGKKKYIQATVSPRFSEDGTYTGAFGVVLDITERKRTEKLVTEMALFAEMNPAPILRTDLDGTISLANRAANELFKVHHLIGHSWFVLCPAVDRKDFDQLLHREHTLQHEYRIGERDFLFTYLSNLDYGLVHIYGTDITDLKQLEAQLFQSQKMEAIGQLAGGIAHDFNSLLGIILGYGDMMRDDIPEDSLIRNNLEGIINAGDRAKALVKQLLDFAGPSEADRPPIRLVPLVEDSLRLLRSSLPTTITIRQQIEAISSTVLANSTQIAQVIMNLGMNAGDAIGEREGEIEMTLKEIGVDGELASFQAVSPGTYVRLSVNDTGCGMSPETLKHIFEPFFTTKEVGKGSGLGLSVVHGIVKSHGGFITVESELGKGSSFQVYFPSNF
jgi:PAS domain S-box-containing protein